jgi:hypothetical protein
VTGTLLVVAKSPQPGRVKTRLTPAVSPDQAAALAEASLADTLAVVLGTPAARRVLALDGRVGDWLPPGIEIVPQSGGGLDERLAAALDGIEGPVLLVGSDTPQVTPRLLALDGLVASGGPDALFGPSTDGGFWALGLRRPDPALVRGVPMSVPHTGRDQRTRLVDAGLRVLDLPTLTDVDTVADAPAVASLVPGSRFARAWSEISVDLRCTGTRTAAPSDPSVAR